MGRVNKPGTGGRTLRWIERFSALLGIIAVSVYVGAWVHAQAGQRTDLASFEAAREQRQSETQDLGAAIPVMPGDRSSGSSGTQASSRPGVASELRNTRFAVKDAPDQSQWSESAIQKWIDSTKKPADTPIAVLEIPKIGLRTAVLEGTDEITLNRGVGWIVGTSLPGDEGNVGIAGHRDSFFRGLQHIRIGDSIVLETLDGRQSFEVSELMVITPDQNSILGPTDEAMLTLVTCFPFYFVGHAPERWIVRAVRSDTQVSSAF